MFSRFRIARRGFGYGRGLGGLRGRWFASVFESDVQRFIRVKLLLDDFGRTLGNFINSKQATYLKRETVTMGVEMPVNPSMTTRSVR